MRNRETNEGKSITVVIKYHNARMLLTLDLNTLFSILLEELGPTLCVRLEEMSEEERNDTSTATVINELRAVQQRFWLFVPTSAGDLLRREDLEERVIHEGRK